MTAEARVEKALKDLNVMRDRVEDCTAKLLLAEVDRAELADIRVKLRNAPLPVADQVTLPQQVCPHSLA